MLEVECVILAAAPACSIIVIRMQMPRNRDEGEENRRGKLHGKRVEVPITIGREEWSYCACFFMMGNGTCNERPNRAKRNPRVIPERCVIAWENDFGFESFENGDANRDGFANIGGVGTGKGVLMHTDFCPNRLRGRYHAQGKLSAEGDVPLMAFGKAKTSFIFVKADFRPAYENDSVTCALFNHCSFTHGFQPPLKFSNCKIWYSLTTIQTRPKDQT